MSHFALKLALLILLSTAFLGAGAGTPKTANPKDPVHLEPRQATPCDTAQIASYDRYFAAGGSADCPDFVAPDAPGAYGLGYGCIWVSADGVRYFENSLVGPGSIEATRSWCGPATALPPSDPALWTGCRGWPDGTAPVCATYSTITRSITGALTSYTQIITSFSCSESGALAPAPSTGLPIVVSVVTATQITTTLTVPGTPRAYRFAQKLSYVSLARASTTITTRFTANWGAADGFVASLACATYVNELQTNCPGNAAISTGTVIQTTSCLAPVPPPPPPPPGGAGRPRPTQAPAQAQNYIACRCPNCLTQPPRDSDGRTIFNDLRAAIARYDVPYLQSKILAIWGPGVTKTRQNPDLAVANIVTAINIVKQNRCKFECVGQYLLEWIKCFESEYTDLMSAYSAVTGLSSVSSNFFIFLEQSVFKYVVNWLKGKIRDDVFERMADHLYSQGLENTLISVRDQCDTRILLCDR